MNKTWNSRINLLAISFGNSKNVTEQINKVIEKIIKTAQHDNLINNRVLSNQQTQSFDAHKIR